MVPSDPELGEDLQLILQKSQVGGPTRLENAGKGYPNESLGGQAGLSLTPEQVTQF